MWCVNVLRVTGANKSLRNFCARNRAVEERVSSAPLIIPLYFAALLPRPLELDIDEHSIGLRGYQALYGNWQELLTYRWIREAGVTDRVSLIRYLEKLDPRHVSLAQQYRWNENKFGFRNWYPWNLEHYGTKWDLDARTVLETQDQRLTYRFNTDHTPPLPWLELLRASFPSVEIEMSYRRPLDLALATA